MADTARAIEQKLNQVVVLDGKPMWQYVVIFMNLGGSLPLSYQQTVLVESTSTTYAPSLQARADAYRAFAAAVPGAVNTIPNTVLATEHITSERT